MQIKTLVIGSANMCRACGGVGHFASNCARPKQAWLETIKCLRENAESRLNEAAKRGVESQQRHQAERERRALEVVEKAERERLETVRVHEEQQRLKTERLEQERNLAAQAIRAAVKAAFVRLHAERNAIATTERVEREKRETVSRGITAMQNAATMFVASAAVIAAAVFQDTALPPPALPPPALPAINPATHHPFKWNAERGLHVAEARWGVDACKYLGSQLSYPEPVEARDPFANCKLPHHPPHCGCAPGTIKPMRYAVSRAPRSPTPLMPSSLGRVNRSPTPLMPSGFRRSNREPTPPGLVSEPTPAEWLARGRQLARQSGGGDTEMPYETGFKKCSGCGVWKPRSRMDRCSVSKFTESQLAHHFAWSRAKCRADADVVSMCNDCIVRCVRCKQKYHRENALVHGVCIECHNDFAV